MSKVEVTNEPPILITIEGHFKQNTYTIEQWEIIIKGIQEYIEGMQEYIEEMQEPIASSSAYMQRIKDAIEPHLSKGVE